MFIGHFLLLTARASLGLNLLLVHLLCLCHWPPSLSCLSFPLDCYLILSFLLDSRLPAAVKGSLQINFVENISVNHYVKL